MMKLLVNRLEFGGLPVANVIKRIHSGTWKIPISK